MMMIVFNPFLVYIVLKFTKKTFQTKTDFVCCLFFLVTFPYNLASLVWLMKNYQTNARRNNHGRKKNPT